MHITEKAVKRELQTALRRAKIVLNNYPALKADLIQLLGEELYNAGQKKRIGDKADREVIAEGLLDRLLAFHEEA